MRPVFGVVNPSKIPLLQVCYAKVREMHLQKGENRSTKSPSSTILLPVQSTEKTEELFICSGVPMERNHEHGSVWSRC